VAVEPVPLVVSAPGAIAAPLSPLFDGAGATAAGGFVVVELSSAKAIPATEPIVSRDAAAVLINRRFIISCLLQLPCGCLTAYQGSKLAS
jgi:hypothetical protein